MVYIHFEGCMVHISNVAMHVLFFNCVRYLLEYEAKTSWLIWLFFPWYSSGRVMSFVAFWVYIIYVQADIWGSAEGVTGTTH
jgi:hypothetical protein